MGTTDLDWQPRAVALADEAVHSSSPWHAAVAATPRHLLVPCWWRNLPGDGWTLRPGADDPERWLSAAYSNRTLVTRVGRVHADHATGGDHPTGMPTSSSTLPGLVVAMFDHALINDTSEVLCVTGSGYGTALLARRVGEQRVTSVDVDPYLVQAASGRLNAMGLAPRMTVCDLTADRLPGVFDRIVSTVGLHGIPASWLTALNPGGRLVTNVAGTGVVIAADKTPDGGARGQVTPERAGFMATRTGDNYPPTPGTRHAWTDEGDDVGTGRYPVVQVAETWELMSAFALAVPGVQHSYDQDSDGVRTAVMVHEDGSWARATGHKGEVPTVHQAGPRRLWDLLDSIRHDWLSNGSLPVYGAAVTVTPDGRTTLSRRGWSVTLGPPRAVA